MNPEKLLGDIRQENMKEVEYEEQSFTELLKADKNILPLFLTPFIRMKTIVEKYIYFNVVMNSTVELCSLFIYFM